MTLEELERFIELQQQALAEVESQREQFREKKRQVEAALAERNSQLEALREELSRLCAESKTLDPASECPANSED
jgi:septal ring factor EnvC (AmiA/AmiB activator)